jgi:hypothetical protein
MTRIGRHSALLVLSFAGISLLATSALAAEVELSQSVDRTEVGDEDTFRLTITSSAGGADDIRPGVTDDFEILSRSTSTQMSFSMGTGSPGMRKTTRYTLILRANKTGKVMIPPSELRVNGKVYRTEAITMTVKKGHLGNAPPPQAQRGSRLPGFPGFPGFPDGDEDSAFPFPDMDIPRSDSDLFLQAALDKDEVYVGEQVVFSIYLMSRVDLTSVDQLTLPKLDGVWTEEIDSPTQLAGEQRIVDGVPYRAYLLKRRALFPMKPGTLDIGRVEADVTTGFVFAGHRIHRKSKPLSLDVKPLPPGAPPNFAPSNVGSFNLSVNADKTTMALGQPATVRVTLEGSGNVRNVTLPKLTGSSALKVYDPTPSEKIQTPKGRVEGRRTTEYLVMPQQTGTFTLPSLSFPYFDPKTGQYDVATSDPITLTIEGGAVAAAPDTTLGKNVLSGGGLRPLRIHPEWGHPAIPVWRRPVFLASVAVPFAAWLAFALVGMFRSRLRNESVEDVQRKRTRAARGRLTQAHQLKDSPDSAAFYGEVEKGLLGFFEAKLGQPLGGLRRDALMEVLAQHGLSQDRRTRIARVLEACDVGRFAPGASNAARDKVLDDAARAMEEGQ